MKRIEMRIKTAAGIGLVCLLLAAAPALAAKKGKTYECVRPDKTVICTVTTTASDPDVVCNHDCKSCNLVCVAVERIHKQGKEEVLGPDAPGTLTPAGTDAGKTAKDVIEKTIKE